MDCLPDYAELHCLSNFSFLRGASHPEELVARAAALGYAALALTDECSLAGIVRAHVAARAHKLKLIVGAELRLEDGPRLALLATDRRAYGALASLITTGRRRATKGAYRLARADVEAQAAHGLLALLLEGDAHWLAAHFPGRAWIAAELHCGAGDDFLVGFVQRDAEQTIEVEWTFLARNAQPLVIWIETLRHCPGPHERRSVDCSRWCPRILAGSKPRMQPLGCNTLAFYDETVLQ